MLCTQKRHCDLRSLAARTDVGLGFWRISADITRDPHPHRCLRFHQLNVMLQLLPRRRPLMIVMGMMVCLSFMPVPGHSGRLRLRRRRPRERQQCATQSAIGFEPRLGRDRATRNPELLEPETLTKALVGVLKLPGFRGVVRVWSTLPLGGCCSDGTPCGVNEGLRTAFALLRPWV